MPELSRWFIRTGLAYLLASLVLGLLLPALPGAGAVLWRTYVHLLVLGWLTQLIFGVAYWMFPRARVKAPPWHQSLGWVAYWCLNAGLLLRVAVEPGQPSPWQRHWLVLSALLQVVAGWGFVVLVWPRIRGR